MSAGSYDELIAEAFIEPIRSVLIVDDDYPTLREVLLEPEERKQRHGHKLWNQSQQARERVRAVIDEFRRSDAPSYILDVHDASSPGPEQDEEQAETLQQTDLLILDYQLDKLKEGNGEAAIRIARKALSNKHFNLILVHTQEDLDRVFQEFLTGLLQPIYGASLEGSSEAVEEFVGEFETELIGTDTAPGAVGEAQYADARALALKNPDDLRAKVQRGEGPWGDLHALLVAKGVNRSYWEGVALFALALFESNIAERFSDVELDVLDCRMEGPRFIRAGRGFVAFKSKEDKRPLMAAVSDTLFAWRPLPSRLTLTKLRAEMNERGIEVQDDALGTRDVGAMWYLRLLEKNERDLDAIVDATVRHHAEQLLDQLLPEVSEFAKKIRTFEKREPYEAVKDWFDLDLKNADTMAKAKVGHNAFVGSKPNRSVHLELGHILRIGTGEMAQHWVCLTPACDMVPGVHRGRPLDRQNGYKRFVVVRLHDRTQVRALEEANRGGQIFANLIDGEGKPTRGMFAAAAELGASPVSMTMYARDDGYLSGDSVKTCGVGYVAFDEATDAIDNLELKWVEATICGMLRYEYALEIQSRFVASQSRIGLDFEASADVEPDTADGQEG